MSMCVLAGIAGAEVVYSNNFSGVEFKAIGVGAVRESSVATTNGVLYGTAVGNVTGLNVDLRPLGLMSDTSVTAVKITAQVRAPLATSGTGYLGFGFTSGGNMNLANATSGGQPWVVLKQAGSATVYGGVGAINSSVKSGLFVASDTFETVFTVYTNGMIDLTVNGTVAYTGEALVNSDGAPVMDFATIQFRQLQNYAAGDSYVDDIIVETMTVENGSIIYKDDFSGAVTNNPKATVPEVMPAGYRNSYLTTGLDGSGHLESTDATQANANYRVRLGINPLTDDASIAEIKYTVTMRTPTNDWVMVGFHETEANGLLGEVANGGPMVQFNPGGRVFLHGGVFNGGTSSAAINNLYALGSMITAEMTYHVGDQTMDLDINGSSVATGFALNHEYPIGTLSDPVVYWAQMQLRKQPSVADGGAYIDSMQVEIIAGSAPEPGYAGWAGGWGVDIGAETNDYDADGLLNIYEYGLGGDPTDALDQGTAPIFGIEDVGGTNWFGYIYPQLSDTNSGLTYSLALNTDLVVGSWVTNAGYAVTGTNVTGDALDFVTNVTDTVDGKKFIRLIIE